MKISDRTLDQFVLRMKNHKNISCEDHADQQKKNSRDQADDTSRMHRLRHIPFRFRTDCKRRQHIDASGKSHRHGKKKCQKNRCRTDRSERIRARKFTYHCNIRKIKQNLQQVRQHKWKAQKQNLFWQPSNR